MKDSRVFILMIVTIFLLEMAAVIGVVINHADFTPRDHLGDPKLETSK